MLETRNDNRNGRQPRRFDGRTDIKIPAFECRTTISLDMDLGYELGNLILDSKTTNPALVSLGKQLTGG